MSAVGLHWTADGPADAPVLVMGSSLGTTTELWRPHLPQLTRRFRVIRYDHRGHGGSPVPPGPYVLDDLGWDVLALLDQVGVAKAHLVGLSLGGMVAMWVAAHAPERVDRMALMCTSAKLGPPSAWAQRAAAVRSGGMAAIAESVVDRWFTPEFASAHPDVRAEMTAMLLSTPPEGYAGCCAAIEIMDLEPVLGDITAPTLVIGGSADPSTPPEHAERIAAGIPGARLTMIEGAAHLASRSDPATVTRALLDFLGGTDD